MKYLILALLTVTILVQREVSCEPPQKNISGFVKGENGIYSQPEQPGMVYAVIYPKCYATFREEWTTYPEEGGAFMRVIEEVK